MNSCACVLMIVSVCFLSSFRARAQETPEVETPRVPDAAKPDLKRLAQDTTPELAREWYRVSRQSQARFEELSKEIRDSWRRSEDGVVDMDMSPELARRLVDELWVDWGAPEVNYLYQHRILGQVNNVTNKAILADKPDIRTMMRDGLLDFHYACGGASDPDKRLLAALLHSSASDDDSEVQQVILELGDPYDVVDEPIPAPPTVTADPVQDTRSASLADRKAARDLLRQLRKFMRSHEWNPEELERIATRAARGFGDQEIDDNVLGSLLRAYRQILLQKNREAGDEVVKIIDADLLRIGRAAPPDVKTRIMWARAVTAMQQRASASLRKLVSKQLETESDKRLIKALRYAGEKIALAEKP